MDYFLFFIFGIKEGKSPNELFFIIEGSSIYFIN